MSTRESSLGGSTGNDIFFSEAYDAFAFVIEWSKGSIDIIDEGHEDRILLTTCMKFDNAEALDAYLAKPCKELTVLRVIHTTNAREMPKLDLYQGLAGIEPSGPPFKAHAINQSYQEKASLGCYVWGVQTAQYCYTGEKTVDVIVNEVKTTAWSFDYVSKCSMGNCTPDRHALMLGSIGSSGATGTSRACARRISIALRHGRQGWNERGPCSRLVPDLNDPLLELVISENSSHDSTRLISPFSLCSDADVAGYGLEAGVEQIAQDLACEYLGTIFRLLGKEWLTVIEQAVAHISYLVREGRPNGLGKLRVISCGRQLTLVESWQEDRIYSRPDDDTPAGDLWEASKNWLTLGRLLRNHAEAINQVGHNINKALRITQAPDDDSGHRGGRTEVAQAVPSKLPRGSSVSNGPMSLAETLRIIQNCRVRVQDDLVAPTNNLLDMLYKSVAIRDAHLSLQMDAGLWRLSWITFIFLPLTFLSGFFGMNVDVFAGDPSIKCEGPKAEETQGQDVLVEAGLRPSQDLNGRGSLQFLVRHVIASHEIAKLEASGFRFAEPCRTADIIRSSMQIRTHRLEEKLLDMARYTEGRATVQPGVHLGMFALRARLDRFGFDVLVNRNSPNTHPTVMLPVKKLQLWHHDFLLELDGNPVPTLLRRLELMNDPQQPKAQFAAQLRVAISALGNEIDSHVWEQASLSARVVQIPCRPLNGSLLGPSTCPLITLQAPAVLIVASTAIASGDVGWVPDLSLGGDRPASPSVLFGADLSAEEGLEFDKYNGPVFLTTPDGKKIVPILPLERDFLIGATLCARTQFPLI
ncbi:hypothetical protein S40293_09963, partial [Stachybotrys chartarum IBT 40293]